MTHPPGSRRSHSLCVTVFLCLGAALPTHADTPTSGRQVRAACTDCDADASRINTLESEIARLREERGGVASQLRAVDREVRNARSRVRSLESSIEHHQGIKDDQQQKLETKQREDAPQWSINATLGEISHRNRELNRLRPELDQARTALRDLEARKAQLEDRKAYYDRRIARKTAAQDQLRRSLANCEAGRCIDIEVESARGVVEGNNRFNPFSADASRGIGDILLGGEMPANTQTNSAPPTSGAAPGTGTVPTPGADATPTTQPDDVSSTPGDAGQSQTVSQTPAQPLRASVKHQCSGYTGRNILQWLFVFSALANEAAILQSAIVIMHVAGPRGTNTVQGTLNAVLRAQLLLSIALYGPYNWHIISLTTQDGHNVQLSGDTRGKIEAASTGNRSCF